jgi:hypothetical protein
MLKDWLMPKSHPNEEDFERNQLALQQTFNITMIQTELEIHRELLAGLLQVLSEERADDTALNSVLKATASRANVRLAELSDTFPEMASLFAKMLANWKRSRGLH